MFQKMIIKFTGPIMIFFKEILIYTIIAFIFYQNICVLGQFLLLPHCIEFYQLAIFRYLKILDPQIPAIRFASDVGKMGHVRNNGNFAFFKFWTGGFPTGIHN